LGFTLACGSLPGVAAQLAAPSPAALELVKVMRWDEFIAELGAHSARMEHDQGGLTQAQFNCVILQPREWTDDVARYFSQVLTEFEIGNALRFFKSPSGQFYLNALREKRDAHRRGAAVDIAIPPQVNQDPEFQFFMKSNVMEKILPTRSEPTAMKKLMHDRFVRALASCPGAKSPS
jgi:hypothetical protein